MCFEIRTRRLGVAPDVCRKGLAIDHDVHLAGTFEEGNPVIRSGERPILIVVIRLVVARALE